MKRHTQQSGILIITIIAAIGTGLLLSTGCSNKEKETLYEKELSEIKAQIEELQSQITSQSAVIAEQEARAVSETAIKAEEEAEASAEEENAEKKQEKLAKTVVDVSDWIYPATEENGWRGFLDYKVTYADGHIVESGKDGWDRIDYLDSIAAGEYHVPLSVFKDRHDQASLLIKGTDVLFNADGTDTRVGWYDNKKEILHFRLITVKIK